MSAARAARSFTVAINAKYCKGCEICVQVCPTDVLAISEKQKAEVVAIDKCTGCISCEIYCPDFAIAVREVESHA